jgi:hypothetical protein
MADRTCEHCGAELRVLGKVERMAEDIPGEPASAPEVVRLGTSCPNPDCPSNDSDLAPLSGG